MKNFWNVIVQWTDKLFHNVFFLIMLSVVLSLSLFMTQNGNLQIVVQQNTTSETINDIKLNVKSNNNEQVVEGVPATVSFTVTGQKADIEKFKTSGSISASLNLENVYGNNVVVPVEFSVTEDNAVVLTPSPKTVTVNVYRKVNATKDIVVSVKNSSNKTMNGSPEIYNVDNKKITSVKVSGAEANVNKVKRVELVLEITDDLQTGSHTVEIQPVAVDENGKIIAVDFEQESYEVAYAIK